jgi:hypothetical protein
MGAMSRNAAKARRGAAGWLKRNDRVIPFFDEEGVKLSRVLTDRGTEYCGNPEHHDYELYLAVEDIDHCERFTSALTGNRASLGASVVR